MNPPDSTLFDSREKICILTGMRDDDDHDDGRDDDGRDDGDMTMMMTMMKRRR